MRVREGHGRGRRQLEPFGAERWAGEERVEWELAAVEVRNGDDDDDGFPGVGGKGNMG